MILWVKRKEKYLHTAVGNVITLQTILRNKIPGNNNLFKVTDTWNKVWLIFVLKGISNYKKQKHSITKINVACSNTNLFSSYYESWHIRSQGIFIICGIFRTQEYLKVRRYLHSGQIFCNVFRKQFQVMLIFLVSAPP